MARSNEKTTLVERRRKELNMTQVQLADYCGLNRMTILDIENGRNTDPKTDTLMTLARVLKVSFEDLYADLHSTGGEVTEG